MDLNAFLNDLHFHIDNVRPPNLEVDWDDAPLTYKLYRGLPEFPLPYEVPLTLENVETSPISDIHTIGSFLWYTFGIGQMSQSPSFSTGGNPFVGVNQMCRRFAPAGGGLYPNELYVYLKIKELPVGVYHYDVAHHRLILLREGNFDSYMERALGYSDMAPCFGVVFVSVAFRKNFFKYNYFSYRLQGLDTGVLMGQLLEVAKRFGFTSRVHFQFLDRAINYLLGLSEKEETVYSVIPLSIEPLTNWNVNEEIQNESICAKDLMNELASISHNHYQQSQHPLTYPMIHRLTEASMLDSMTSDWKIYSDKENRPLNESIPLPRTEALTYDLASICRKRYSPGTDFVLKRISQLQLSSLLEGAMSSFHYENDLDCRVEGKPELRISMYGCLNGVEGIPDGAYLYDNDAHTLCRVRTGDHRMVLQEGMAMHNVNLFQVPLCLHIAGRRDHLVSTLGYRGYRISQMEAGMLVQRVLLIASVIGMGGHAILGFDAQTCDDIYQLDQQGKTTLIQIPIGPYRPRPKLEASLHG